MAAVLLVGGTMARAAPVTFAYTGVCSFGCASQGIADGARASGRVVFDDAGFTPGGVFLNEALIDFSFDLGGIRLDRAGAAGVDFQGLWNDGPRDGMIWILAASAANGAALGPTISLVGGFGNAGGAGARLGSCTLTGPDGCDPSFGASANFELTAAPVPLPAPLALLGAGLASLAALRRFGRGGGSFRRR